MSWTRTCATNRVVQVRVPGVGHGVAWRFNVLLCQLWRFFCLLTALCITAWLPRCEPCLTSAARHGLSGRPDVAAQWLSKPEVSLHRRKAATPLMAAITGVSAPQHVAMRAPPFSPFCIFFIWSACRCARKSCAMAGCGG
jgi:hypothetical protein